MNSLPGKYLRGRLGKGLRLVGGRSVGRVWRVWRWGMRGTTLSHFAYLEVYSTLVMHFGFFLYVCGESGVSLPRIIANF